MRSASHPVARVRRVAKIEAISFLVLLGVAMPLKYAGGIHTPVKVVGWIHGLLFVALCFYLVHAIWTVRFPLRSAALVFVASLLPFGPFVIDHRIRVFEESEKFAGV